jgi:hypothetical protein
MEFTYQVFIEYFSQNSVKLWKRKKTNSQQNLEWIDGFERKEVEASLVLSRMVMFLKKLELTFQLFMGIYLLELLLK